MAFKIDTAQFNSGNIFLIDKSKKQIHEIIISSQGSLDSTRRKLRPMRCPQINTVVAFILKWNQVKYKVTQVHSSVPLVHLLVTVSWCHWIMNWFHYMKWNECNRSVDFIDMIELYIYDVKSIVFFVIYRHKTIIFLQWIFCIFDIPDDDRNLANRTALVYKYLAFIMHNIIYIIHRKKNIYLQSKYKFRVKMEMLKKAETVVNAPTLI